MDKLRRGINSMLSNIDEYDEDYERSYGPKTFVVRGYFDDKYRGLDDENEFEGLEDFEKALEYAWDRHNKGNYLAINGNRINTKGITEPEAFRDVFKRYYR